ncbi:zinc ribbon domain-containing protein [Lysobacter enzymogenes]|uniref:Zinc ribbon domain-containing protein n=1 Tax=Lysobacter enzymogenes TaxID=69 RepID=A0A3N2RMH3_LYSEN|nr:zinc ribbon domain-containing protein [Lysobacter enzymogenes]ROU08653.1 zinc ribbon domain-containing protein [Lysobacter enzymogenes]
MDNATVGKRPCPECGGDLQWNAAKQALACPYCGTVVPLAQAPQGDGDGSAQIVEHDLEQALARLPPESPGANAPAATASGAQDPDLAAIHATVERLARTPGGAPATASGWSVKASGADGGGFELKGSQNGHALDLLRSMAATPPGQRGYSAQRREVQCQSCHAISVFVDGKVADRCEFCGSPSIIDHESLGDAITPESLLPFKVSDGQVRDAIRKWYGSRWFAPNRLKTAALTDTLKGVYLPYWTFDADVSARWSAEAGYYYYETQSYTENGERKTREVQKVRWEPASGSLQLFFNDELVPGTVGVHADLLQKIGDFPTATDLKPYSPEFVRGWTVERYQVDLRQAARRGEAQMRERTRDACSAEVPGDTQRNLQVDATLSRRTFKHVLVPVWLVSYTYGSRSYQVLANGYTGALAGERPYSWIKIAFAVAAAAIALLVLLLVFGGNR